MWSKLVAWITALPMVVLDALRSVLVLPAFLFGKVLLKDRAEPEQEVWSDSRRLWMPPNREIEISVVMPAYNPGDQLRPRWTDACRCSPTPVWASN